MRNETADIHDGAPWTEMDIDDLTIEHGASIEEAAQFLCRSGTINEVKRKSEELRLRTK